MDSELVFEQNKIKALSVDTRVNILKLLDKRRYTLSELAELLKISKPTTMEHLAILIDANLVKKLPSDNKWIYYELTSDGKKVVRPEGVRVLFMFGFSAIATMIVGILLLAMGTMQNISFSASEASAKMAVAAVENDAVGESLMTTAYGTQISPTVLVLSILFAILIVLTIILYFIHKRCTKK